MIASSVLAALMLKSGFSIPQLFLVTAILSAAVAVYIYTLVPEFLMRFLCWLLIHSVDRLRKSGLENIPETGPAIITCNHVSLVDALVIMAAIPRLIRFVMDHNIFKVPVLSFVFRTAKAIPIAPAQENPALRDQAFDDAAQALKDGDLVGIFPEGCIMDTGELHPFRRGTFARIELKVAPEWAPQAVTPDGLQAATLQMRGDSK